MSKTEKVFGLAQDGIYISKERKKRTFKRAVRRPFLELRPNRGRLARIGV
jgi:hypothetical protein